VLASVWKNDPQHIKEGMNLNSYVTPIVITSDTNEGMTFQLDTIHSLKQVSFVSNDRTCLLMFQHLYVLISTDGVHYQRMYEDISEFNSSRQLKE